MVKSLDSGREKWLTKSKGDSFKRFGAGAADKWAANTGRAFGVTVGPMSRGAYSSGINATDVGARDANINDAAWTRLVEKAKAGLSR